MKITKATLVYQAGIANVFAVDSFNLSPFDRNARRLIQYDFRTCENFAQGMAAMGCLVASAYCNEAGDISGRKWSENMDEMPFSESARPVWHKVHPMSQFPEFAKS